MADNKIIKLGTSSDLKIFHDGGNSYIQDVGTGSLRVMGDSIIFLGSNNTEKLIEATMNGSVELYYDNSRKFYTSTNGAVVESGTANFEIYSSTDNADAKITIVGKTPAGGVGQAGRVEIVAKSTSTNSGGSAMHLRTRKTNNTVTTALTIDQDQDVSLPIDGQKLRLGASQDLQIYHGTNSYIDNTTGGLYIRNTASATTSEHIYIQPNNTEHGIIVKKDAAVELYNNGSKRFETTSYGNASAGQVRVTSSNATTPAFSVGDSGTGFYNVGTNAIGYSANGTQKWNINSAGDLRLVDSVKANFGTGDDLQIYHDGSYNTFAGANFLVRNAAANETLIYAVENGASELWYDNSKKFETTSDGAKTYGDHFFVGTNGNASWDQSADNFFHGDSVKASFGNANDLQIYHDGTHSHIKDSSTGELLLSGSTISLNSANSQEYMIKGIENGALELYHDNSKKFETSSYGTTFTGNIAFNRTNVNAGDGSTQTQTSTPNRFVFNNNYSNGYTDASLKIYLFNDGATRHGFTSGPAFDLQYHSSGSSAGRHSFYIQNTEKQRVHNSGVHVYGDLVASGNVTAYSDQRLKTDIHTINDALSICGKLRGVSYKWIADGKPSIGVIAQEVEKVIPEVVLTNVNPDPATGEETEVKSVDYGKIVGVLINAINELKAEVDELKGGKN